MITWADCVHQEHLMREKELLQFNAITPEIKIYLTERKLENIYRTKIPKTNRKPRLEKKCRQCKQITL